MATQKVELTEEFIKVNNGGIVDTSGCMIVCKSDSFLFGTSNDDTPPLLENTFIVNTYINYSGDDNVYIRARNGKAIVIVDSI